MAAAFLIDATSVAGAYSVGPVLNVVPVAANNLTTGMYSEVPLAHPIRYRLQKTRPDVAARLWRAPVMRFIASEVSHILTDGPLQQPTDRDRRSPGDLQHPGDDELQHPAHNNHPLPCDLQHPGDGPLQQPTKCNRKSACDF